jgi:hypothetical protein
MIRCIVTTSGKPICVSSEFKRSKRCLTLLCRIRLSKDLLELFAGSTVADSIKRPLPRD